MTLKRLASLQILLLGGLGSVFLLPRDVRIQPAAVTLALPVMVGDWQGSDVEVNQGEREILGPDTQFARKMYLKGTEQIFVSVVLSGPDMNTSIHRPERCLPAQGLTIIESKTVPLAGGMAATRLHNIRNAPLANGQQLTLHSIQYYWFIGHSAATPSHYERAWIDIRDRVLKGENQQWAYITISSPVTKGLRVFGRDEEQIDQMLHDFVRDLLPELKGAPAPPGG